METAFYFVRHGQTDYNAQSIIQGRDIDAPLNEQGRRQGQRLAERMADVPLTAIYASTQRRARQTAELVAARHEGIPIRHERDLEEMAWGIYEGDPPSPERREAFNALYQRWRDGAYHERAEGGESILEVQERALRAARRIAERERGGTVLVVAHGRLLRVLLSSLLPDYGLARMHEIRHGNTSVNHLVLCEDTYEARLLNCTAHLDELQPTS